MHNTAKGTTTSKSSIQLQCCSRFTEVRRIRTNHGVLAAGIGTKSFLRIVSFVRATPWFWQLRSQPTTVHVSAFYIFVGPCNPEEAEGGHLKPEKSTPSPTGLWSSAKSASPRSLAVKY